MLKLPKMSETKGQILFKESLVNIVMIIPKLSPDLEIHPFDKKAYVIRHKTLDYRVQINLETHNLINCIDGERSIEQIGELYENRYKGKLSEQEIYELLFRKLAKFGIIELDDHQVEKKRIERYLRLSFIFLKPNKISFISRIFKFLFAPVIFQLLFSLMTVFIGTAIAFNFNTIVLNVDKIFSFNILYYLLAFEFGCLFHEIGHASACRKYGASPGGIGFGFYLFLPVLFSDVSDAWRLKPGERIAVNLGGIYFEMILASLMLLGYYISHNFGLLIIPCILILSTLSNLNPFIKYDGYWILSDAIGVPNLHKNANKKFIQFLDNLKNRRKIELVFKDYFLIFYEVANKTYIFILSFTVLILNPDSIFYFPSNVYAYLNTISKNIHELTFPKLSVFFIPTLFYVLAFQFILALLKSKMKSRNVK